MKKVGFLRPGRGCWTKPTGSSFAFHVKTINERHRESIRKNTNRSVQIWVGQTEILKVQPWRTRTRPIVHLARTDALICVLILTLCFIHLQSIQHQSVTSERQAARQRLSPFPAILRLRQQRIGTRACHSISWRKDESDQGHVREHSSASLRRTKKSQD